MKFSILFFSTVFYLFPKTAHSVVHMQNLTYMPHIIVAALFAHPIPECDILGFKKKDRLAIGWLHLNTI